MEFIKNPIHGKFFGRNLDHHRENGHEIGLYVEFEQKSYSGNFMFKGFAVTETAEQDGLDGNTIERFGEDYSEAKAVYLDRVDCFLMDKYEEEVP